MTQSPDDRAERRRRMDEVFGDVLPETTSDERDPDDSREESSRDTWFRDQVPPHHG
jgi:hypothetical protein